ncbi:MAG: amino acid adenylation domain-containing protein, partial [Anaerolineae bacterium]|nr:amino acid adenylation domain-containing protein [Anaerolineae bacterium]
DAALKAVLTTSAQSHLLPEASKLQLEQVTAPGVDFIAAEHLNPRQIAYIMYTSGSTGRPKGVVITHANLLNYMLAAQEKLQLGPGDSFLALTTISFDISATELLLPLMFGATVVVGAEHLAMDGMALLERLQSEPPSHLQATPSTWKLLLAAGWTGSPELTMLAIGEKMERRLAEALLARGQKLWNFYGPTETTIASTGACLEAAPDLPVPIGKPLRNTQIYLLDSALQPVPPGATGDLYIGGQGVADGYWHRPDLTAERFLANPFRPGERMYRTGDLARQDLHGVLFYLGRDDDQVKIHGIRVELGEVEQALQRTEAVRDVVVTAWQDNHGDFQLVAHVIAAAAEANVTMVREQARAFLPEALVPPFILFTKSFPLSANGKVRRSALPAPRADAEPATQRLLAPQTPTEKLLAEAWAEVLDLEVGQISRDANFLEIGGHSLAMTPLMLAIRRRFHVDFRLAELFAALTVQSFARLIDERRRSRNGQVKPRETVQQRRTEAYGQQRMAYLRQEGEYAEAELPGLILLDLNMPRKDGREALQEIRSDPKLRRIPVVILTTSKNEADIYLSYDIGANSYITKPVSFQDLVNIMRVVGRYWFETVEIAGIDNEY